MLPIAESASQRNRMMASSETSHLSRPGPHRTIDGRVLPPLLTADEMTAWAMQDVEPVLWQVLGVKIDRGDWAAKQKKHRKQWMIANAMADLIRDTEKTGSQ